MSFIVNERDVVQKQIAPSNILASEEWPSLLLVNPFPSGRSNSTSNFSGLFAKQGSVPIFRDHTHLGLLVAGLHFHTGPIFLRCGPELPRTPTVFQLSAQGWAKRASLCSSRPSSPRFGTTAVADRGWMNVTPKTRRSTTVGAAAIHCRGRATGKATGSKFSGRCLRGCVPAARRRRCRVGVPARADLPASRPPKCGAGIAPRRYAANCTASRHFATSSTFSRWQIL